MISLVILLAELLLLYFFSKFLTNELFFVIAKITRNQQLSLKLITIIYLPGTIIHEVSHFLVAFCLFLKVRDVSILPEFKGNYIKLGHVRYIKADFFRGFLVGIAPLVVGISIFYTVFQFHIFPSSILWQNIVLGYLLFILSLSMFSSKQDMVDAVYLIPLGLFIGILIYIFNINLSILLSNQNINSILLTFIGQLQLYMLFVFLSCVLLWLVLKLVNKYILK